MRDIVYGKDSQFVFSIHGDPNTYANTYVFLTFSFDESTHLHMGTINVSNWNSIRIHKIEEIK